MYILFGKRKFAKEHVKPTLTLDSSFAQEVLDLEEKLNLNCTLSAVARLMELYTKAIEFYEAEKNLKHIHYQERMQSLLTRSNVIQLFNSTQTSNKHNNIITGASKNPNSSETKAPSPKNKLWINTELKVERTCDKVIKQHTVDNVNLSQKLHDNIKNQYEGLNLRLFERKKASTPRINSNFGTEGVDQCDISAGEAKKNSVEEFEKEVERILEKHLKEKIKVKQKIKEKYQEYFDETELFKGEIKEKLLQELTKNMDKEIMEYSIKADKRRNEEISAARQILKKKSFIF